MLFLINQFNASFLTEEEISSLKSLNTASKIISEDSTLNYTSKSKSFTNSSFQNELIYELDENEEDNSIFDSVYSDLVSKGWKDYDGEKEELVHQRYNMNTNYDTIEIQSPYYDEVKSSINKIFHSKIKRNCFESSFIEKIRTKFRVYDPSKLLYTIVTRPDFINWIPENISEKDFLSFSNFDTLINEFIQREEGYITLVEFGNQRVNRYKELNGTCYFEVKAFLKNRDFDLDKLDISPFIQLENQHGYEMSLKEYSTSSFPIKEVIPLIQVSYNNFRGEKDLINANLFSDSFSNLGIREKKLLDVFIEEEGSPLKAISWIDSYSSSPGIDRRRYKPKSEGITFKINKELLLDYLNENDLVLCYNVLLSRSADKYISENHMNWYDLDKNIEIDL